jgi:twitching motility protein PilI
MSPLELLYDYERRVHARASSLPRHAETGNRWSGIVFRLGEDLMLAPMEQVAEILDPPQCTRVPGTRSWFMGIANVRGSLLPVTDLHGFAHSGRASNARNSRLLVYNKDGVRAGVRVDDVLGLRQFPLEESGNEQTGVQESLQPYIERTFRQGEQVWPVFSLALFADSRAFLQIGKTSGPTLEAVAS